MKGQQIFQTFVALILYLSFFSKKSSVFSFSDNKHILTTSHTDLSTQFFSSADLKDFESIVVDQQYHQIIAGARNFILRLDLRNLTLIERVAWRSSDDTKSICLLKGQSEIECENYVKMLHLRDDRVLACATNSHSPICTWRLRNSLSTVLDSFSGVGKCSTGVRQNSSFTMTSNGDLYSAAVTDFAGRDAAIYRSMGPSKPLRTNKHNSKWLNEPDFISSHEIGDFIYFFFREVAIEYINCGKAIYSRVARICKSDKGGRVVFEDNWTSFLKARLNCSIPGKYPFYYNELQATHLDVAHGLLYATFTTPPTSIYGSAVCVYNVSSIESVFSGDYKYQENSHSAWLRVKQSGPPTSKCGNAEHRFVGSLNPHLVDIHLMDDALQPSTFQPLILADNMRYTHMVVDTVHVIYRSAMTSVKVVYVTTLEGVLHKYVILPDPVRTTANLIPDFTMTSQNSTSCLVEIVEIFTPGILNRINYMMLDYGTGDLIIGTTDRLYRIPKQRCNRHKTKSNCERAQDPHCSWDELESKCSMEQLATLSSCPVLRTTDGNLVDAEWSNWSNWETCNSTATQTKLAAIECRCRHRSCTKAKFDGRDYCNGPHMEIINCTVVYESQWMLSEWGEWSECSSTCEGGQQKRHRACIQLSAQDQQHLKQDAVCPEAKVQYRFCNVRKCKDVQQATTPWSRWYPTLETNEGRNEDRLRCVCRSEATHLCRSELQIDSLYCSRNGSDNSSQSNCRITGKNKRLDEETNSKGFMLKINKSLAHLKSTSCYKRLEESDMQNEILKKKKVPTATLR